MKKIFWGIAATVATVLFFANSAGAVSAFSFSSFDADYYLTRDENKTSQLRVSETLVAEFSQYSSDNHGIERAIPERYKFDGSARTQTHSFDLRINKVTGGPFETRSENGMKILRIGDPDAYARGQKTYGVDWSATNVTRNFDDGDEFYWKANGDGWSQRFAKVTARVHIPADLVSQLDGRVKCEVGDSPGGCAIAQTNENGGKLFTFTSTSVAGVMPNTSLTFDIGFKPGTFATPKFDAAAVFGVATAVFWGTVIGAVVMTLLAIIWLIVVIAKFRPTKTNRAIIPEYLPPSDMTVAEAAMWWSKTKGATKVVPASIIDAAVKHYVRIYEIYGKFSKKKPKDYGVEIMKTPDGKLDADTISFLNAMFDNNAVVGAKVELKQMAKSTSTMAEMRKIAPEALKRMRSENGYYRYEWNYGAWVATVVSILMIVVFVMCGVLESALPMFAIPAIIIAYIGVGLFNPVSKKGAIAKDYLKGLEMYMKVGEAERLKVLQSVKGAERVATLVGDGDTEVQIIKLYERLMPYAVIFGITNDWAKALQVHYEADASMIPSWYLGANLAAFNAASFATAMNNFSTSSYVSGAGSTSSGGSGLSGGGGFSGGGGGGGGGGGW